MNTEYVLILLKGEKEALGSVRCIPGLQAAEADYLYLRSINEEIWSDKRIHQLPVLHSYRLDEEERLFPLQGVTPVDKLPSLSWQSLSQFITPELPVSPLPGKLPDSISIQLKPTDKVQDGTALLTTLSIWKEYAEAAPEARLRVLRFAASGDGHVLVLGNPLPPIQGREFYQIHKLLLPSGYVFEASVIADLIQQKQATEQDLLYLFVPSGEVHTMVPSSFVKATRSAVRLTTLTNA